MYVCVCVCAPTRAPTGIRNSFNFGMQWLGCVLFMLRSIMVISLIRRNKCWADLLVFRIAFKMQQKNTEERRETNGRNISIASKVMGNKEQNEIHGQQIKRSISQRFPKQTNKQKAIDIDDCRSQKVISSDILEISVLLLSQLKQSMLSAHMRYAQTGQDTCCYWYKNRWLFVCLLHYIFPPILLFLSADHF